jgi:hypothetical protein
MHRDNSQRTVLPDGSSITLTTAPDPASARPRR